MIKLRWVNNRFEYSHPDAIVEGEEVILLRQMKGKEVRRRFARVTDTTIYSNDELELSRWQQDRIDARVTALDERLRRHQDEIKSIGEEIAMFAAAKAEILASPILTEALRVSAPVE